MHAGREDGSLPRGPVTADGPSSFLAAALCIIYMAHLRVGGELRWLSGTSCSGMGVAELLAPPDAENWGLRLNLLGPAA